MMGPFICFEEEQKQIVTNISWHPVLKGNKIFKWCNNLIIWHLTFSFQCSKFKVISICEKHLIFINTASFKFMFANFSKRWHQNFFTQQYFFFNILIETKSSDFWQTTSIKIFQVYIIISIIKFNNIMEKIFYSANVFV